MADPKKALELLEANDDGCTSHKPYNCSMRKKVHKKSQPTSSTRKDCVRMKIEITFRKVAVKTSLLINLPENSKCSLEDSGKKCHGEHKISVSNRIGHRIFYLLNQGG